MVMVQIVNKSSKAVTFSELFTKKYSYQLALGFALPVIQQFSGINAILFYSTQIIQGDNPTPEDTSIAHIITAVIGFLLTLSAVLGGKFIDRFGRKVILIIGEVIVIVCLLTLAGLARYYRFHEGDQLIKDLQITFMLIFVFGFGMSLGPIVWLYIAEILPSSACSMTTLINWFSCALIGYGFNPVKEHIYIEGCFLIFGCVSFAGLLVIIIFVKETRRKTNEEIEAMFTGDNEVYYEVEGNDAQGGLLIK